MNSFLNTSPNHPLGNINTQNIQEILDLRQKESNSFIKLMTVDNQSSPLQPETLQIRNATII
jgi:hypothetical protein